MIYRFRRTISYSFLRLIVFSTIILLQTGCGVYSFSSSGGTSIKSIAIPIFQDQTSEFGIREKLTGVVVDVFTRDNTLKIAERRNADSLLEGKIVKVNDQAGAFSRDETVQDIKITITVSVKYQDLKKRKVIWEEVISQWGTFNPDNTSANSEDSDGENATREAAIDEAVAKIASDILNKSVSGW